MKTTKGINESAYATHRTEIAAPECEDQRKITFKGILVMGKYVLGWLLGVPVFVLVMVYVLFN